MPRSIMAQENFEVHGLEIRGLQTLSADQIKSRLNTYATGWIGRTFLGKETFLYSEDILQADLTRIVRYCQREGFLYASAELADLKVDEGSRSVNITINITEGDSITVREVSWQMGDTAESRHLVFDSLYQSRRSSSVRTGHRFRDTDVDTERRALVRAMENKGYPYCEVIPQVVVDHDAREVDLTWSVRPGPRCRFSEIKVSGDEHIDEDLIRGSLTISEGDTYSRKAMDESQRHIYNLSLFHVVTVTAQLRGDRDSLVPVEVMVREAPRLTAKIGLGYGREEKFRAFLDSYYNGMFGGARRTNLFVKHSDLEPYHVSIRFIRPAFLTDMTTLEVNPFVRRQDEPGFTVNRYGGNVSLLHEFTISLRGSITYSLERVSLDTASVADIPDDLPIDDAYNKSSILLGLTFDNSHPVFSPSRGFYAGVSSKISGLGFGSDYHFTRLLVDFRRYQPVLGMVLAGRVKAGGINSTDDHDFVPVEDRFYSGGSASVRGWARAELGPLSDDGRPIGGKSLFESSLELRYPIYAIVSGAVFTDFGNVWLDSYSFELDDLRYSAGFGFRVRTPIGPVRLDVAWPIDDVDKTAQFHISVGEAF